MSPDKKPTRALDIYVRYSALGDRDKDKLRTLEQQEARCRKQLDADGLEAGELFADKAVSGGKSSRPNFDKALERARSGESGGIIVHDLTRWGRYSKMADDIIELEKQGATIISCEEKLDTSNEYGRFFLRLLTAMAVLQREQVEGRLKVSQRDAVARGIHISPNVPPGYNRGKDGKLVPDPQHKVTMAQAFRMAAQGKSRSQIAKYLTERKLPSAGRPIEWAPSRIGRLLSNPAYKGQARYGKIVNDGAHAPIIDPITWKRAQRQQEDPAPLIPETTDWLLSGFVRCASCRYAMRAMPGRPSTIPVYRCHCTNAEHKCEHPTTISMRTLDAYVYEQWANRLFDKEREPVEQHDPPQLLSRRDEALAELEQVQALELSEDVRKAAEDAAVKKLNEAEAALAAHQAPDMDKLVEELAPKAKKMADDFIARGLSPEEVALELTADMSPEEIKFFRHGMARDIRAVFVRPSQTKGRGSKPEDRVQILWAGDELPKMPRRGVTFTPTPYTW